MKEKIFAFIAFILIFMGTKAYAADNPAVSVQLNGKFEKGQIVQFLINVSNISSFYAGQMDFKYDNSIIKITSLKPGDLISKTGINKFEAINKVDQSSGTASYAFSCLGKINGFSGSGTFVVINAEILKDSNFYINSKPFLKQPDNEDNLRLILCDSNITELNYSFTPYENIVSSGTGDTSSQSGGSTVDSQQNSNPTDASQQSSNGTSVNSGDTNANGSTTGNSGSSQNLSTDGSNANQKDGVKAGDSNLGSNVVQAEHKAVNNGSDKQSNSEIYIGALVVIMAMALGGYLFYRKKKLHANQTTGQGMEE